MIHWIIKYGDILDEPVDVLICSANVFLNLSGGVGGELLLRYGPQMQAELHRHLSERHVRHVVQGEVVVTPPCNSPYKAVLHAVAVDGFYQSTPAVIEAVVGKSLSIACSLDARGVALTALATGYGRLTFRQFAQGVRPLMSRAFRPIEKVVICVRQAADRDELVAALPEAEVG